MDLGEGFGRGGAGGLGGAATQAPGDVVLGALDAIRSNIAGLREAALWARSDTASRDGVREGFAVLQSLQAAWLGLVADLDSRPEAVAGPGPGRRRERS